MLQGNWEIQKLPAKPLNEHSWLIKDRGRDEGLTPRPDPYPGSAFSNANHQLHFRLASVLIVPIQDVACIDMNKNLVMQIGHRSQTLKTIPVIGQGPSHPACR